MIDAAINAQERRALGTVRLSSGKAIVLNIPLSFTADDVIEFMVRIPAAIAEAQRNTLAGSISLPGGATLPVRRE